ncbi:MAG: hypothetical protein VZR53_13425, partial [Prevotella sp.]|nr:hypothetical protein [Prevotella sp.]
MTDEEKKAYEEKLIGIGYTKDQIEGLEQLGIRATKAATEVRTFSAMIDALKEAVGSGWAQTWEIIFGNMEEATEMWTAINDVLSGFIGKFSDARNAVLQDWKDLGGRTKLLEGLANVFHILGNVIQPIKDAITLVFPPFTGKNLADITNKFAEFTGKIREATEFFPMKLFGAKEEKEINGVKKGADESADSVKKLGEEVKETADKAEKDWSKIREAAKKVINGDFGNDSSRKDALKKAGFDPDEIQSYVDKVHELSNGSWDLSDKTIDAVEKSLGAVEKTEKATEKTTETAKKTVNATDDIAKSVDKTTKAYDKANANVQRQMNTWYDKTMDITDAGNLLTFSIANAMSGVVNIFKSVGKVLGVFRDAWKDSFSGVEITMGHLVAFDEAMRNFADKMIISEDGLKRFHDVFKNVFTLFKTARDSIIKMAISAMPDVLNVITNAVALGKNVINIIGGIINGIASFLISIKAVDRTASGFTFILKEIGSALSLVLKIIGYLTGVIAKGVSYVANYVGAWAKVYFVGARISSIFIRIKNAYLDLKKQLAQKIGFSSFEEFANKADAIVEKIKNFVQPAFVNLMSSIGAFAKYGFKKKGDSGLHKFFSIDELNKQPKAYTRVFDSIINKIQDFKYRITHIDLKETFSKAFGAFKNGGDAFGVFKDAFAKIKLPEKGVVASVISLDKEDQSVSKIISFFNKAREVIRNAISNLVSNIFPKKESGTNQLHRFFPIEDLNQPVKKNSKPLESFIKTLKNLKDRLSTFDLKKALTNAFSFFKDTVIPKAIQFVCDMLGKFETFVAKLDFKKLLLAAKTARTIVKIFNGIKLAKSFSGMADSIGGFFDNLGGRFGGKEESKATSFLKIAASLALVAKAISIIAAIPADRLDSAVGVVAGIAIVMTGITIALEKIKPKEGADLKGATKYALSMAVSVYIIAKAIEKIAQFNVQQLRAAEEAIVVIVAVMTAAMFAMSKIENLNAASVAGPIGFAIAIKILAKTIAYIGNIPDDVLEKGKKNISKIGLALALAMVAMGFGHYNAATVAAPIAFAVAVFILATQIVALGLLPTKALIKGAAAVKFIENTIKSAMKGLTKLKGLGPKVVAAPLAFAVGVYLLGKTVSKLGELSIPTLAKGIIAVGLISAVLVGAMWLLKKFVGDAKLDNSTLNGLIAVALSIFVLGYTVAKLGELKAGTLAKGIIAIGFVGAILSACVIMISKYELGIDSSTILGMIVVTAMLVVLATTAALLGFVPLKNVLKGGLVMLEVAAVLAATMILLKFVSITPMTIASLIPVVASLVILATTAALIGFVPLKNLIKGVYVIGSVAAILVASMILLRFATIAPSTIFGILFFVVAIVVLASEAVLLGAIPTGMLAKGMAVILLLGAMITAAMFVIGNANIDAVKVAAILAFMVSIQLLCFSVLSLGVLPISVLAKGLGVIAILSTLLTVAMHVIGNGKFSVIDVVAPLVFVGAILTLAYAVVKIGSIDTGTLIKGTVVIGLIMAGIVIALKELSTIMGQLILMTAAIPGLLAFVGVIGVLAYVVTVLGKMSVGGLAKGLVGLVGIVATMVIAFKMMGTVSAEILIISAAFMMFGIAAMFVGEAFVKVATALLIFTQALMLFTTLKSEEQFTGLAIGLATLGVTLLVFIGIIVGFVAALYLMPALIIPLLAFSVAILMIGTGLNLLVSAIAKFIVIAALIGPALVAAISSIASSAGQILSAIGDAISGAIDYIVKNAPVFMEKAGKLVKSAVSGISKEAPNIKKKVGEAITKAIDWIKKNFPKWLEAGGELIKNIVAGIVENAPKVLSKIGDLLSKAVDAIKRNLPKWLSMGKELVGKLISGLLSLGGKLASEAGHLGKKALEAIKRKVPEWKSVGKNMVAGLISGIMSRASEVAN